MSDVLIIAGESSAFLRLREALELDGYTVATAPNLIAALSSLYLSPCALRVILSGESADCSTEYARLLAAADPGLLGRHSYAGSSMETHRDRLVVQVPA